LTLCSRTAFAEIEVYMGLSPFGFSPFILEIKIKDFLSSADGAFFFPFVKGKRSTFSLSERKSCKKKQTSLLLDLLASMGSLSTKARSLFANAYLKVHSLLGERNFAVHGSLSL
jgi:hypothetical protein